MVKKTKKADTEKEVKKITDELLSLLQVKADVEAVEVKEEEHVKVNIKTEETGLLIGHHGETLNSLQLLLGILLYKKLGTWVRVVMDVGDYRKMREENLKEMVTRIVGEVEA